MTAISKNYEILIDSDKVFFFNSREAIILF